MQAEFIKSAARLEDFLPSQHPEIAFFGRSNAGKSSILNALTNCKNLARTSREPGRTRLANFFVWNAAENRNPIMLVDLPGYGFAKNAAEIGDSWTRLVDSYLTRPKLECAVLVMDARRPWSNDEDWIVSKLAESSCRALLVLLTKADKINRTEGTKAVKACKEVLSDINSHNNLDWMTEVLATSTADKASIVAVRKLILSRHFGK